MEDWLAAWGRAAGQDASRWRRAVGRKAAWIARHDKFLLRTQPERYARVPGEAYPLNTEYRRDGMHRVTVPAVLEKIKLALDRYLPGGRGY